MNLAPAERTDFTTEHFLGSRVDVRGDEGLVTRLLPESKDTSGWMKGDGSTHRIPGTLLRFRAATVVRMS